MRLHAPLEDFSPFCLSPGTLDPALRLVEARGQPQLFPVTIHTVKQETGNPGADYTSLAGQAPQRQACLGFYVRAEDHMSVFMLA